MLFRLAANSLGSVAEMKRMATGRATKYFRRDVDHVEQLFRCQVIPPEQVAEHRAGAVQRGALIGIEQEDEQVVQQQEHQHEGQHKPDFPEFDLAQPEGQQS